MSATPKVEILYSAGEIAARVDVLAGEIVDALGPDITVIAVLKGSFVFTADLLRAMHHKGAHPRIDFMSLSSYGSGKESSGNVEVIRDIADDVAGRKILLVDDILESGRTLAFAKKLLSGRGAQSVDIAVLLEKPGKRVVELEAEFIGYVIPDKFVVGYGLDFAHLYRELPYIGVLPPDTAG